jgi:hypothetical protein
MSYYDAWEESDLEELDSDYACHSSDDSADDEEDAAPEDDEDVEYLDSCWGVMFARLQRFHNKHGHCLVVIKSKYSFKICRSGSKRRGIALNAHYKATLRLGYWVSYQRRERTTRNAGQQLRLENIGFIWNVHEHVWDTMRTRLVAYKALHDNCNVPRTYQQDDPKLGKWVHMQRTLQKSRSRQMNDDRKEELDGMGFIWNFCDHSWRANFERLVAYKAQHHDCNVPRAYQDDPKLGNWVHRQRMFQKSGQLNDDRKEELDGIGFIWNVLDHLWGANFDRLVACKAQHHDCKVPQKYKRDRKLGVWVSKQRTLQKKGKLNAARIEELSGIDFIWNV